MLNEGKGFPDTDGFRIKGTIDVVAECGEQVRAGVVYRCNGVCLTKALLEHEQATLTGFRDFAIAELREKRVEGTGHIISPSAQSVLTVEVCGTGCGDACPYIPRGQATRTLATGDPGQMLDGKENPSYN